MKISARCDAKINLTLDILGKRADGYHELRTIMQSVGLFELVTVENNDSGEITLSCSMPGIPCDGSNIAVKCARAFYEAAGLPVEGLHISIEKHIPVQAGLAGGSADGAAVLHALNRMHGLPLDSEKLRAVGKKVGADIPFCLLGGTALAQGIGEKLSRLPDMPDCRIVIVKPSVGISTKEAYDAVDSMEKPSDTATDKALGCITDIERLAGALRNDFEQALRIPVIDELTSRLRGTEGCIGACMSGSGSAVFGIFTDEAKAEECAAALARDHEFAAAVKPTRPISEPDVYEEYIRVTEK